MLMQLYIDLAAPDIIKFGIESKYSSPFTSTGSLKKALVHSLDEMKKVCLAPEALPPNVIVAHL